MKKETAIKYAGLFTENGKGTFYADFDSVKKSWYVYNVFRRFYTCKELLNYVYGGMCTEECEK